MIPTVNFHITKACNYSCKFCFATFDDISEKGLTKHEQKEVIRLIAKSGYFRKLNFAGGEPFLLPHLPELIAYAKELGLETSVVTNGSRLEPTTLKDLAEYLDIFAISVDSLNPDVNRQIGRWEKKTGVISQDKIMSFAEVCHQNGIFLKINTVVCRFNKDEKMTDFINLMRPKRWKVLQVSPVKYQNDKEFDAVRVSDLEFRAYVERNREGLNESHTDLVSEDTEHISDSYLMVDLRGRFYSANKEGHKYSPHILEVGVEAALEEVQVDEEKFRRRGGEYSVKG